MSEQAHRDDDLEPAGVHTFGVLATVGGFALLLATAIVVLRFLFLATVSERHPNVPTVFPQPRLTAHLETESRELFSRQRRALGHYRWLNAEHTLVAIPIERAMQIVAGRGAQGYAPIVPIKEPAKGAAAGAAKGAKAPANEPEQPAPAASGGSAQPAPNTPGAPPPGKSPAKPPAGGQP